MGVPDKQLWYKGDNFKKWLRHEGYHDIKEFLSNAFSTASHGKKHRTKLEKFERAKARFHKNYEQEERWSKYFGWKSFERNKARFGEPTE